MSSLKDLYETMFLFLNIRIITYIPIYIIYKKYNTHMENTYTILYSTTIIILMTENRQLTCTFGDIFKKKIKPKI